MEEEIDIKNLDNHAILLINCNGNYQMVKLLLDYGVNVHDCDDIALIEATEHGYKKEEKLKCTKVKNLLDLKLPQGWHCTVLETAEDYIVCRFNIPDLGLRTFLIRQDENSGNLRATEVLYFST